MKILNKSEIFTQENISKIESMRSVKYVCETCLRGGDGGWINQAAAIFWDKNPKNIPEGGSAWFGLFYNFENILMITNAISAIGIPMDGVIANNEDIIYSRFRHDYRISPDGTVMIDGGRDYFRSGPTRKGTVILTIVGGDLIVKEDNN